MDANVAFSAAYDSALAVNDRGVITASGLGPADFARAIFAEFDVFSASDEQLSYDMHNTVNFPTMQSEVMKPRPTSIRTGST